ncbi:hypothetical protein GCM10023322_21710 [Rugosimonospora acidiphila]|uniref:Uncharacterized protein n=2 Tax=Rugosimonospora acidiphila TaxID=556531 RepID=A0ABP9RQ33_9ACTN
MAGSAPMAGSPMTGGATTGNATTANPTAGGSMTGVPAADTTTGVPGADEQSVPAADRGGITALAAALRSMTAARPIVQVAGKPSRPPSGRPLIVLCVWAALLGLIGLGIGIRGLVVILANHPPSWFKPSLILCGLVGILLTAAGFVTARRGFLPWTCLGAATAVLIASIVVSTSA